ncbi:hypothetical protein PICMEDRAFT_14323 [Pichia membranifaciens NRRL Y-2026]|uniref:Uncharacterized protein n=1 Tax=Pichia membranifaciens NRRL Y-2026 TaxID=763406 RepID=A0A1E3NRN7_9ASCO|nr:hypothetical protein PICMEDRAFT_14323 [Pichia membranifaciens NRRL Y-2026]ODQ48787.1 hypothetical protein PICMEDRAFT_14323 [Pichia membranifaciens NRRL Y-2026]
MSMVNDFVTGQQNLLAQELKDLSLNNENSHQRDLAKEQNGYHISQQGQNTQASASAKKRRGHHAFHNLTSPAPQAYEHEHVDPNEAASAVGLFPPQFSNQYDMSSGGSGSQNANSNFLQNNFGISPQMSETSRNDALVQKNDNGFSNDIYNINQATVAEDLSVPGIRNHLNEIYKEKEFLSFEHVSPPLAGTEYKAIDQANSIPQFSRLSMYSIPFCEELREKSKIPLGFCLRPFADYVPQSEVPMKVPQIKIQEGEVVPRCRRCRAYLNPAMQHNGRNMICNICGFASPVPEAYASTVNFQGVRDDYHLRPELHTGVVDYIVPKEYNLNENEDLSPLHRVFLIDLTHASYKNKLVETVCSAIRMAIYREDGSSNLPPGTLISIMGFDNNLHFYKLSPELQQTTVSIVTDLEDPFVPFNDGLFVDPVESYNTIDLTLTTIEQNARYLTPEPALGSALTAAGLLLKELGGGQVVAFLSTLPSFGPGASLPRNNNNNKLDADFVKETLTPASKYYKNLATEFVKNNVGLNLFVASNSNVDLINLGTLAVNTGGTVKEWLPFNVERDDITLIYELKKVIQYVAGYQSQLKVRCSHGLQVNKYYGPFATVNGDSAPNIPIVSGDTSIVCDFIYDSKLDTKKDVHFQAALLYTTSEGVRKVRVINNILSVTQRISDVFDFSDQDTIVKILIKRAIEKISTANLVALKSSLMMQCSEIMAAYKYYIARHNAMPTQLVLPQSLRTLPMVILSILKTRAFANKTNFPDLRVYSFFKLSQYDLTKLSAYLYPLLFCIHSLEEGEFISNEQTGMMNLSQSIPVSVGNLAFGGAYLVFNGDRTIIWLHSDVNVVLLQDLFGSHIDSLDKLTTYVSQMPVLDTYISSQVRNICDYLAKHFNSTEKQSVEICRFRTDPNEQEFQSMFVEDKSLDLVWSYAEFLKELHKNIENKTNNLNSLSSKVDNDGENLSRRFGIF